MTHLRPVYTALIGTALVAGCYLPAAAAELNTPPAATAATPAPKTTVVARTPVHHARIARVAVTPVLRLADNAPLIVVGLAF